MDHWVALLLALAALAYALITRKLSRSVVTGPMIFAALGLLLGPAGLGWVDLGIDNRTLHWLAELTLMLVLFTDAASTDLGALKRVGSIAGRMLGLGLPLAVLLGTAAAWWVFPEFTLWQAALLAAMLAPTDAALSQPVIDSDEVPKPIRTTVDSESGLNDGLALPMVLLFAALASGTNDRGGLEWLAFLGQQLIFGPLAGIAVGAGGGWLIQRAWDAGWMQEWAEGIGALAIAFSAFLLAETIDGNGFLAAFCGGLAMGHTLSRRCRYAYEFQESEAQLLVLGTFFVVGAALLPVAFDHFSWTLLLFSIFALSVMRMLAIALSLVGAGLPISTVLFLGWFGPRGLASVLFAMIVVEGFGLADVDSLLAPVALTVALSIVVHGLSAAPLARWIGRRDAG